VSGYRLLLLDLDGTLLGRDGRISPRVANAVRWASERLTVSIATGREIKDVRHFASELGLTAPQICDNGALILDPTTGNPLFTWPLGDGPSSAVTERLLALGTDYIATHPGGTLRPSSGRWVEGLVRISALDLPEGGADRLVNEFAGNADLEVIKAYLPYNGLWAVDFTHAGVNKGTAARWVQERTGANVAQTIAAGDSYNDVPLFRASGHRIAMADAPEELKAMATFVAPSVDEDGLAVAIENFAVPLIGAPYGDRLAE
jgi:hydroxymethylpyrimidine pyrophosphatase-like HAD family hydrolase